MQIREVLAKKPVEGVESIRPQVTMRDLVARLRERRIGAMMVLDGADKVAGIISERDVVRALAEEGDICLNAPVSNYMTREVVRTSPDESAVSVLERMTEGRFRHMPVLEDGAVVGVVSIGDLVKARIDELKRDNEALAEFIRS